MLSSLRRVLPLIVATSALSSWSQAGDIKTQADLDAAIAAAKEPAKKNALQAHTAAIQAAIAKKPHVDAVIATLGKASATFEKINTTPEALKQAAGGDLPVFDTLKTVSLANSALGIKAKRETDPFDHAFYEHLGQITDLESLAILHTTAQNADLVEVAKLKNLKVLNITNQSKLNDEGLAHLAGLKNLERFAYVGTSMTGKPFKNFDGWTKLKSSSFRGSKIDDEGIKELCEHFGTLESISLAHAHFTDAAAVHLAKLKNLKGLELGLSKGASPEALRNVTSLPLEYLQLGEGVGTPAGVAIIKDIPTLRKLTITGAKDYTDADVTAVAGMKQLEHVELGSWDLTEERLPILAKFAHLKSMRLVRYSNPYTPEVQAKVQAVLPKVAIVFQ